MRDRVDWTRIYDEFLSTHRGDTYAMDVPGGVIVRHVMPDGPMERGKSIPGGVQSMVFVPGCSVQERPGDLSILIGMDDTKVGVNDNDFFNDPQWCMRFVNALIYVMPESIYSKRQRCKTLLGYLQVMNNTHCIDDRKEVIKALAEILKVNS